MREVPLSNFGLLTVQEAAELRKCDRKTIQRWVKDGHISVVPLNAGGNGLFLVIAEEVRAFTPRQAGRPAESEAGTGAEKARGQPRKGAKKK